MSDVQSANRSEDVLRNEQLKRLDASIAQDIERRAKRRRLYWILLGAIAAVAGLAVLLSAPETEQVATAIAATPQLREVVANSVAQAPAVKREIRDVAREMASAAAVAALVRSPEIQEPIRTSARAAVRDYLSDDACGRVVTATPIPGSSDTLAERLAKVNAALEDQHAAIAAITRRLDDVGGPSDRREIDRLAGRVRELSAALDRQPGTGAMTPSEA